MNESLHYLSLHQVAKLIKTKQLSPVELTRQLLQRIESLDGKLHSYATVTHDLALQQAEQAEVDIMAGNYKGPLHGIPVAIKDLCYTRNIKSMGGLKVRRDFIPDFNATVVNKLADAGSVLLGKLALTEGALSGYHKDFEIPVNPWGEDLWAGVSSSGSGVATAAGLCFGSLGTDTGGSIRYPSMANGIVGLKPTYGRVSRYGVIELAGSLDHVGPMTRSVVDAAIMLEAIAGKDDRDPSSLDAPFTSSADNVNADLSGIRIGVDEDYISNGTDPGLVDAIQEVIQSLQSLGAELVNVNMPKDDPMELRNAWIPVTAYEAARAHAEFYPSRADEYGGYLGDALRIGHEMSEQDYAQATQRRQQIAERFEAELNKVDAVICPSGGSVFPVEKAIQYGDMETLRPVIRKFQGQFTLPADLAGTPTLTVPCGFSERQSPYAVQFLGRKQSEDILCRIGCAYQSITQWHEQHPPL
jgi:amidase